MSDSDVGNSDVQVGRRETCLSCEREGRTTRLVPYGHWGICPVCEPALFHTASAFHRLAEMERLIKR